MEHYSFPTDLQLSCQPPEDEYFSSCYASLDCDTSLEEPETDVFDQEELEAEDYDYSDLNIYESLPEIIQDDLDEAYGGIYLGPQEFADNEADLEPLLGDMPRRRSHQVEVHRPLDGKNQIQNH